MMKRGADSTPDKLKRGDKRAAAFACFQWPLDRVPVQDPRRDSGGQLVGQAVVLGS